MIKLQINISDSPNGTIADINFLDAKNHTEREKEIADSISNKIQAKLLERQKGSVSIIEQKIQPEGGLYGENAGR